MKKLLSFLLAIGLSAPAATITGPIGNISGGSYGPRIEFWPESAPFISGTNVIIGTMKSVAITNGTFSTSLVEGRYLVKFPPTTNSFRVWVPTGTSTYSLYYITTNVFTVVDNLSGWTTNGAANGEFLAWTNGVLQWTNVPGGGGTTYTNSTDSAGLVVGSGIGTNLTTLVKAGSGGTVVSSGWNILAPGSGEGLQLTTGQTLLHGTNILFSNDGGATAAASIAGGILYANGAGVTNATNYVKAGSGGTVVASGWNILAPGSGEGLQLTTGQALLHGTNILFSNDGGASAAFSISNGVASGNGGSLSNVPAGLLSTNNLTGSGTFLALSNSVVVLTNASSSGTTYTNDTGLPGVISANNGIGTNLASLLVKTNPTFYGTMVAGNNTGGGFGLWTINNSGQFASVALTGGQALRLNDAGSGWQAFTPGPGQFVTNTAAAASISNAFHIAAPSFTSVTLTNTGNAVVNGDLTIGGDTSGDGLTVASFQITGLANAQMVAADGSGNTYATNTTREELWIPASAMNPAGTAPAPATNSWATTTDGQKIEAYDFDSATSEAVQFTYMFPASWDYSTVKAKFVWKAVNATALAAVWSIAGGSITNGQTGGATLGTAVTLTNTTGSTTNIMNISPASAAITLQGNAATNRLAWFEISRVGGNDGDTLTNDARLIGVQLQYGRNIGSPAWTTGN